MALTGPAKGDAMRIGYTCPYIPVEILSATGLQPYALLHGTYDLMQRGTEYVRIDACPLVRASIAYILENADRFAAFVGTTGCDMSRRLYDVVAEHIDIPIFLIHMPRTDNYRIYSDEIDWMIEAIEKVSLTSVVKGIEQEIGRWEGIRNRLSRFDAMRYTTPPTLASSEFHAVACAYYKGICGEDIPRHAPRPARPRVYLVGSELSYENGDFLRLLEEEVDIVGDAVCGLSQFLNIKVTTRSIEGIKQAYYRQPPCIYRRPNHLFYDQVLAQIRERRCEGIIGFTLDYCDAFEFEMKKMEKSFGLPLLRIRTDYAAEKVSQLKTRIAAFGEMLCSRK